jgi:hypothetical protein
MEKIFSNLLSQKMLRKRKNRATITFAKIQLMQRAHTVGDVAESIEVTNISEHDVWELCSSFDGITTCVKRTLFLIIVMTMR